ncbi:MAG: cysteine desulfurase [Bacilli bacterium]|nr:cysteine desulfurase [Bacilli bacterium]
MNREDFPMLEKNLIYLDNGATTLKPQCVIDSVVSYYREYCANAHRGDYSISQKVDSMYEGVREQVKNFIHAKDSSEIVFTSGTTDGLNRIVFGYFRKKLNPGDEVLITESEHASNVLPWFQLAKEKEIVVKYIPLDAHHEVTMDNVKKSITSRTKVISLAYITNVIGDIRPMREIIDYAHQKGILVVGDGAQSMSHLKMNVTLDDIDFFVASAHKMYGPTGVGFLYGKFDLLNEMDPTSYGGGMNAMYLKDGYVELREVPTKFEAGTQNIAGVIGMGKAISYLENIGMNKIMKHEHELKNYLVSKLKEFDNIIIYNEDTVGSIVTFNVKDVFSQDTAIYLDKHHICIRSGNHCSKILNQVFDISNTCRVSLGIYNTYEEIDALVEALKNIGNIWMEIL